MTLLLVALAVLLFGGLLAVVLSPWPRVASFVGAGCGFAGCVVGAAFAIGALRGETTRAVFAWRILAGEVVLGGDALAGFFLLPLFALGAVAAIYGHDYLLAYRHEKSMGVPWLAYDVLLASMVVVVTARHAVLFLIAWEVMSLSSYVLVVFEHEHADVQRAGWVYLIAAHLGTAFLVAMFLLLASKTGSFVFDGAAMTHLAPGVRTAVLLLALVGFGVKAGLIPLHVWLPEAHAAAPSHVSALMSGVLTKMGVYGIVRMTALTGPAPAWWGGLLLVVGLSGALFGIAMASYQRDIKRALAYSTIENVGLVMLGLGLGYWGYASGHPTLGALGVLGGLLHAWNHTAMKGLLFLGAGTILHATGTKDLERLGGLMRRAPGSSSLFVVGAVAIAGLPPLAGFASEWLLYRSLLDGSTASTDGSVAFMLAVGAVSAVGALAALTFLRLGSTALLGQPRSEGAASAHEASPGMVVPMAVLALVCVLVGATPAVVVGMIASAAAQVVPIPLTAVHAVQALLAPIGNASLLVWGLCLLVGLPLLWLVHVRGQTRAATWGCGYAAPTARMQYTGRAFAQLSNDLLPKPLRARIELRRPTGLFPAPGELRTATDDPVTRGAYEPALARAADGFARLRWLQQGVLPVYLLYILVAVVLGLAWSSFEGWNGG